jgi:hypothetical protein
VGKERVFVNKNHNTNFVAQSLIQPNNDTAQILFSPIFVTENTLFYGTENLQNTVVFVPNLKTETDFLAQIEISPKQRFEEKINKKQLENRETKTAQNQIYPSNNNPQNNAHYFWRNAIVNTSSTNYPKFFDKTHSPKNTNISKNWTENETKNSLSFAYKSPKELHPSINIYKNRPPPVIARRNDEAIQS